MNRAKLPGVLALSAVLLGGTAPCGAMVVQDAPAGAPDSDGDGMPDLRDADPLVADLKLTWTIRDFAVGWVVTTQERVTSTEEVKLLATSTAGESNTNTTTTTKSAALSGGVKAHVPLSLDQSRWFGLLDSQLSIDVQAKAGLSWESESVRRTSTQRETRSEISSALKRIRETQSSAPFAAVWIEFSNLSRDDLFLEPAPLPVIVGGRPIGNASIADAEDRGSDGTIRIPANRSAVLRVFKAPLDTTPAQKLLESVESESRVVRVPLEGSSIRIFDSDRVDLISVFNDVEARTTPVTVSIGGMTRAWRVARVDRTSRAAVTLRQAMDAVSTKLTREMGVPPLFAVTQGGVERVFGVGLTSDDGQWVLSFGNMESTDFTPSRLDLPLNDAPVHVAYRPSNRYVGIPVPKDVKEIALPSGLRCFDIVDGNGKKPLSAESMVQVHYTGYLSDGTKFDSSVDRGVPLQLQLDQAIKGWREGVASMKVGGIRKLVIPHQLAYGVEGRPPVIPASATLIFDIQLLDTDVKRLDADVTAANPTEQAAADAPLEGGGWIELPLFPKEDLNRSRFGQEARSPVAIEAGTKALEKAAAAYKSAPGLTDTVTLTMKSPMGDQTDSMKIMLGTGTDGMVSMGDTEIVSTGGKLMFASGMFGDKYVAVPLSGGMGATLATKLEGVDLPVPHLTLREGATGAALVKAFGFGPISVDRIGGYKSAGRVREVLLLGDDGCDASVFIDSQTGLIHAIRIVVTPPDAPPGLRIGVTFQMKPKIINPPPRVTFDPKGRTAVATLDEAMPDS